MSFRIRNATTDDIVELARLHVQTFNETHRSGRPGGVREGQAPRWRGAWVCWGAEQDLQMLVGKCGGS